MVLAEWLGPFQFALLEGRPSLPKQQTELVVRPGVNGVGAWLTGIRGVPFRLQSTVDVPNYEAGQYLEVAYPQLVGQAPVGLLLHNFDFGTLGVLFRVLDVSLVEVKQCVGFVGGLNLGSTAVVRAQWDLVAVAV